jgi:sulfur-oxidizing protein SoxY
MGGRATAEPRKSRRDFLIASAGVGLAALVASPPARATPEMMKAAIDAIVGEAPLHTGKVTLSVPPLVENGNVVPITVSVDSPMSEDDHVTAIHVVNEKNPQPQVATFRLGPRAGRAAVSTRIKLADAQRVVAIAELRDGSFWSASADVIVTIAACVEDVK